MDESEFLKFQGLTDEEKWATYLELGAIFVGEGDLRVRAAYGDQRRQVYDLAHAPEFGERIHSMRRKLNRMETVLPGECCVTIKNKNQVLLLRSLWSKGIWNSKTVIVSSELNRNARRTLAGFAKKTIEDLVVIESNSEKSPASASSSTNPVLDPTKLLDELKNADVISARKLIQEMCGESLPKIIYTEDGSRIGILCVKYASIKQKKLLLKSCKEQMNNIITDPYASLVIVSIFSHVNDIALVSKVIINELKSQLNYILFDEYARRPLLQLLCPDEYLSFDDLADLNASIPSLEVEPNTKQSSGTKDPSLRKEELLMKSGLAESLLDECIRSAGQLLKSDFGKDIIYEVSKAVTDAILCQLGDKFKTLYEIIGDLVSEDGAHLLENIHSGTTLKKLYLECPNFALVLRSKASTQCLEECIENEKVSSKSDSGKDGKDGLHESLDECIENEKVSSKSDSGKDGKDGLHEAFEKLGL